MEKVSVETVQREVSLQARVVRKDWGRWSLRAKRPQSVEIEDVVLRVNDGVRRSGGER